MNKLLSANFVRLWKNKVFWLEVVVMFIWAALMLISAHRIALAEPEYSYVLEDYFFQYAPVIGGFCAVFTSLFLGTDYSDGTIRNKIAVGHSRQAIYLSNVIVSTIAGIIMNAAWILAMLTIGTSFFGWFKSSMTIILAYLLITVLMIVAFASIFTLISMLNQNKASAAIIALLAFLAILFLASYCNNRLTEPEMFSAGPVITTKGMELSEAEPNPNYVSGHIRKVYEFFVDFLPAGQGILMSSMDATHLLQMPLYSLIITITTTIAGIFCFRKKDLK
jgi:ABC-type transport system involved in multi-copper enzyme maturation permease subunit